MSSNKSVFKCSISGCNSVVTTHEGLCGVHYKRQIKWGITVIPPQIITRIKEGMKKTANGCIEYYSIKGLKRPYPKMRYKGVDLMLHRIAWESKHKRLPTRHENIRHKCDNPFCINPDHLEAGSAADNGRDVKVHGHFRGDGGKRIFSDKQVSALKKYAYRHRHQSTVQICIDLANKYGVHYKTIYRALKKKYKRAYKDS